MVVEIAADGREMMLHLDAERAQRLAVADAGELQDLRRADGAASQDHLAAGPDRSDAALALDFNACGPSALDHHAPHQCAGHHLQVGARADRPKERGRHGLPPAVADVGLAGAEAFGIGSVEVGTRPELQLAHGRHEILGHGIAPLDVTDVQLAPDAVIG